MDSIQGIKNKAFIDGMNNFLPDEGETFTVQGGLGNKTLAQRKKENGIHYKRNNEKEDWVEYDVAEDMLNFIKRITREK